MIYKHITDVNRIENIIDLFVEYVSKQPAQEEKKVSFSNGYLLNMEGYKPGIFIKASEALKIKEWKPTMVTSDEIASRAIKAMNISENNLVHWKQKTLFEERLKQNPILGQSILYSLYCSDDDEQTLERLAEFFGRRYDLLAYLFFTKDPDQYYPCRPTIFKKAFKDFEVDTDCFESFTYDNYVKYNETIRELATVYSNYMGHIGVLDAHSFAFIIGRYEDVRSYIFDDQKIEKLDETKKKEKETIVRTRVNQSEFRKNLIEYWGGKCAVTGCESTEILIASHIKPWRDCELNSESVSVYNGLLLTPNLDALFDAGYISFDDNGSIIISSRISDKDLEILGVPNNMKLRYVDAEHKKFLKYHRENVFRG